MAPEFARILFEGVLPNLGNAVSSVGGFKNWVVSGAYHPKMSENGDLILQRVNVEAFTKAVSYDYDRFALSAQESRIVALSDREKFGTVSWPLLKQYYSAFFAAHAVMRSRGAGIVRIDGSQASIITYIIQQYMGVGASFKAGNYYFSRSKGSQDASGEISVSLFASKDGKGVHDGFWVSFIKYLEFEAEQAVKNGFPDNQAFLAFALQLKQSIMVGEAAWLSKVRNEINYQHEHQSWMPLTKKSPSNLCVPRSSIGYSSHSRLDIERDKDPIKAFFCTCCYLSEINFEVAARVAARSKVGGSFGQRWVRLTSAMIVGA